jgi:transposase
MRAAVEAAHRAGGSIRVIAAEINRSTRTIQNWLHAQKESTLKRANDC